MDEQLPRGHSAKWHSNRVRAPRCVCKQPLPEKQALVMFGDRDEGLPRVPHSREHTHPEPLVHGSCTAAHKPSQGNTLRPQAATHVHASPSSASSGEIFTVSKTMGLQGRAGYGTESSQQAHTRLGADSAWWVPGTGRGAAGGIQGIRSRLTDGDGLWLVSTQCRVQTVDHSIVHRTPRPPVKVYEATVTAAMSRKTSESWEKGLSLTIYTFSRLPAFHLCLCACVGGHPHFSPPEA